MNVGDNHELMKTHFMDPILDGFTFLSDTYGYSVRTMRDRKGVIPSYLSFDKGSASIYLRCDEDTDFTPGIFMRIPRKQLSDRHVSLLIVFLSLDLINDEFVKETSNLRVEEYGDFIRKCAAILQDHYNEVMDHITHSYGVRIN